MKTKCNQIHVQLNLQIIFHYNKIISSWHTILHIHTYTRTRMHAYTHTHTNINIHTQTHTHTTYTHTNIHTDKHTHTHTHTYTCNTCMPLWSPATWLSLKSTRCTAVRYFYTQKETTKGLCKYTMYCTCIMGYIWSRNFCRIHDKLNFKGYTYFHTFWFASIVN